MKDVRSGALVCVALGLVAGATAQLPAKALRLMQQGEFAEALPLVEAELQRRPQDPDLLHLRAVCKGKLGRHDEAIVDATRALELDPEHAASYGERAYNLFLSGRLDEALADYDRSLELEPANAMAHGERGDLLVRLGRYRDAMAAFERAIELAPRWPHPHANRAEAARALGDFEAARESALRAVEMAPDELGWRWLLAGLEFDCGRDDDAVRTSRQLYRRARSYHFVTTHGRLLWQLDRYADAKVELDKAVARGAPEDAAQARLSLACLHLALGEHEQALAALDVEALPDAMSALAPWFALLRWCARYAGPGRARAAARLRAELDAAGADEGDFATLVAACLTAPDELVVVPDPARRRENCPVLFFAAWRALADGDAERADELLLRCVNTGAKEYQQWQVARTMLLRRHGADAFTTSIGADLRVVESGGRRLLAVAGVEDAPLGAAAQQGLRSGDVVLRVADAPYDPDAFLRSLSTQRVGRDLHLTLRRDGDEVVRLLQLGWRR